MCLDASRLDPLDSTLVNQESAYASEESGRVLSQSSSIDQDARALRATFRELGFDRAPRARTLGAFALAFVATHALVAVSLFAPSWPIALAAAALAGPVSIAMATIGHTASHGALTGSAWLDRLVVLAGITFGDGISAQYWMNTHVQVHHAAPNVIESDNDCNLRPFFCINDADLETVRPALRGLFRFQIVWLVLLLPFNGLNIQRKGLVYWWRTRERRGRSRRAWCADGLAIGLHLAARFAMPLLLHISAERVFSAWAVWLGVGGVLMFAVLAPGHFPHAARVLARSERRAASFWLRQTATTVNFRTGWLGARLCSGLEHQIEHHLFPGYCHVHYPKMAPLVHAFCKRHGLPYAELGWGEAIVECLRTFLAPKPTVSDLRVLAGPTLRAPEAVAERRTHVSRAR
jgi:fatty acid desaturase